MQMHVLDIIQGYVNNYLIQLYFRIIGNNSVNATSDDDDVDDDDDDDYMLDP